MSKQLKKILFGWVLLINVTAMLSYSHTPGIENVMGLKMGYKYSEVSNQQDYHGLNLEIHALILSFGLDFERNNREINSFLSVGLGWTQLIQIQGLLGDEWFGYRIKSDLTLSNRIPFYGDVKKKWGPLRRALVLSPFFEFYGAKYAVGFMASVLF